MLNLKGLKAGRILILNNGERAEVTATHGNYIIAVRINESAIAPPQIPEVWCAAGTGVLPTQPSIHHVEPVFEERFGTLVSFDDASELVDVFHKGMTKEQAKFWLYTSYPREDHGKATFTEIRYNHEVKD